MALDKLEITLDEAIQVSIDKQKRELGKLRDSWQKEKNTLTSEELILAGDVMLMTIQEMSKLIDELWDMCNDGT